MIELEARKWLFTHKSKSRNLERILPSYTGGQTAGTKLLFIPNLVYPDPSNCGWSMSMDTE